MTFVYIIFAATAAFFAYDHFSKKKDWTLDWQWSTMLFSFLAITFAMDAYISYTG